MRAYAIMLSGWDNLSDIYRSELFFDKTVAERNCKLLNRIQSSPSYEVVALFCEPEEVSAESLAQHPFATMN